MKKDIFEERVDEKCSAPLEYEEFAGKIDKSKYVNKNVKKPSKLWLKITIPSASAVLAASLVVVLVLNSKNGTNSPQEDPQVDGSLRTQIREAQDASTVKVSQKSVDIYNSFLTTFTPYIFSGDITESVSYSPFDAFVNVAINALTSSKEDEEEFLSLLGSPTLEEVTTSVKELTLALGTTSYTMKDKSDEKGGYSANSLFLDPNYLDIKEDETAKETFQILKDNYYSSVYLKAPKQDNIVSWLEEAVPSNFRPLPEINIPDSGISATVSSYFIKKSFSLNDEEIHKKEYQNKNHYMDYSLNGSTKKVDYLDLQFNSATTYQGDSFSGIKPIGDNLKRSDLGLSLFLPDTSDKLDETINNVLKKNYTSTVSDGWKIDVPYFKIKNKLDLLQPLKDFGLTKVFKGGINDKIVSTKSGDSAFLAFMKQFSLVSLDYSGFYSASVTVSMTDESTDPSLTKTFKADKSFVFMNSNTVNVGDAKVDLPICIGAVVDPNYEAYK